MSTVESKISVTSADFRVQRYFSTRSSHLRFIFANAPLHHFIFIPEMLLTCTFSISRPLLRDIVTSNVTLGST